MLDDAGKVAAKCHREIPLRDSGKETFGDLDVRGIQASGGYAN
jgi:hypothetical protein